jgi:hypothetical protein
LTEAGDIAAGILRGEAGAAPGGSDWLDDLGNTLSAVGAHVVNGLASFGNAMLHHPGEVLAAAAGVGLVAVSAAGEVAGLALDTTGVGAVAGVPLNAVSAAGIATGVGIMGAAVASIASHAAGGDHVFPVKNGDGAEAAEADSAGGEPPREITGLTEHGEQRWGEMVVAACPIQLCTMPSTTRSSLSRNRLIQMVQPISTEEKMPWSYSTRMARS